MPRLDDIRKAKELGRVGKEPFIWRACPECGKTRWVRKWSNKTGICRSCSAKKAHALKPLPDGYIRKAPGLFYKWQECPQCNQSRWVRVERKDNPIRLCRACSIQELKKRQIQGRGEKNSHWKGGRFKDNSGYIKILLTPDNPFYSMAGKVKKHIPEHRLIMAQHLGRCLQRWEVVHHKNGIKDDNGIENLELTCSIGDHSKQHSKGYRDGYLKGYQDARCLSTAQVIVDRYCVKDG